MGVTRQAVIDTASGWVGMLEETGNNDIWFSRDWGIEGQSWCFAFTQSGFYYAPVSPQGRLPHSSMYCPYGIAWARENNQAIEVGDAGPQPGDIVFFSWDMANWPRWRSGTGDHVGIVEGWDGGDTIWTIEGNVGSPQGVYRKVRSISETVVCFWRPIVFDDSLTPAAVPAAAAPTGTPDGHNVRYMQQFLADHGMNPGPVDGELGPMTAGGVTRWQQALANAGFNPGPIDGDWGPLTTAATAAWVNAQQPALEEEDMTPEQDARLTHLFNIFADGDRWAQWFNESRSAAGAIAFIQDPRDGKVWMVWGTMWKRHIQSPEILSGFQAYWGAHGANTALQAWDPIHIDSVPDANTLLGDARGAHDLSQSNGAVLAEVRSLAKGELPPPEHVVDVEASLAQATPSQLISALAAAFGAQPSGPKPPVVAPNDPA